MSKQLLILLLNSITSIPSNIITYTLLVIYKYMVYSINLFFAFSKYECS